MQQWKDATIPAMVNALRRDRRDSPALTFRDRTTTFGELADLADRISAYLIDAGMAPNDRIALLLPPSDVWASIHYGVIGAGCVVVPITSCLPSSLPAASSTAPVIIAGRAGASV